LGTGAGIGGMGLEVTAEEIQDLARAGVIVGSGGVGARGKRRGVARRKMRLVDVNRGRRWGRGGA
jgi:hypothetical protein